MCLISVSGSVSCSAYELSWQKYDFKFKDSHNT